MAELPLLAKPDVLLVEHLEEVLGLGADLVKRLGLDERLRAKALLACALHDIGKATLSFQAYIRGERKPAYPHALASLPIVLVTEGALNQHKRWAPRDSSAAAAVLSHHSPLGPALYKGYEAPDWHPDIWTALQKVWERLAPYLPDLPHFETLRRPWQALSAEPPSGLLHEPQRFPDGRRHSLIGMFQELPPVEFAQVKAVLHLADWLASAKKPNPGTLFLSDARVDLRAWVQGREGGRTEWTWREFQRRAEAASLQGLRLRAPTGTGKTEALLLWAGEAERLIYLLPTQATVNAMWRRLRRIYGDDRVGLAHGRAGYLLRREADQGEEPLDVRLFGSVFARPVTVATLDQYLLAHLQGRHWEERRTLTRRAAIVLDEIHAYEPYTLGLLLEALEREPPARLALASATLPDPLLELFPPGTLVEAEAPLWQRRRHRLELRPGSLREALGEAIQYAREGKTVLIVANTVREAQQLYQTLREEGWERLYLLHSRFIFRDRQEMEKRVENPGRGTLFVATQVVEVSLDLSYDVLLTEAAPLDALVQRLGRVNRSGVSSPAPVLVFREWSEGAQRIYGREVLEESIALLEGLPAEPTDEELAQATQRLYQRIVATADWQQELQEGRKTLEELQRVLGCYTIDLSDEQMRARFTARRGDLSLDVLPQAFQDEIYGLLEERKGWRLVEFLVPVPIWWLRAYPEHFNFPADLGLPVTGLPYGRELGLLPPESEGHPAADIW